MTPTEQVQAIMRVRRVDPDFARVVDAVVLQSGYASLAHLAVGNAELLADLYAHAVEFASLGEL